MTHLSRDVPDPVAFADLVCDYCLAVDAGEQVVLRSTTLATPLLLELQRAVLARDAWPILRVTLPGQSEGFFTHARDTQLDGLAPLALEEARQADCSVTIQAPHNTRSLAGIASERLARFARSQTPLSRARAGKRWCNTLWPTDALAQQAGMSLLDYGAFVSRALFLDRPDPVAAWGEQRAMQARLIERLAGAGQLRLEAEGTDLRLEVAGRTWVNSDGRRNMPSGEVFTGPLEGSANGWITFSLPTSPTGVEVADVTLRFRDGEVVQASAGRGNDYLQSMLELDPGARRLGEIGIGTNRAIDRSTGTVLLDEKIGGTVHLALGRSYPETGGLNMSALHWDLICDMRSGGTLSVDGEVVQRDGTFTLG